MNFADKQKRYLIVGAGKTGQSVARYLQRHGANFSVVDTRDKPPCDPETFCAAEVFTGGFDTCNFNDYDVLLVSPGVSLKTPEIAAAIKQGVEISGDIELFAKDINARKPAPQVLAVTGSNGKSTVVSMIGSILMVAGINHAVGGNLGTPALDLLAPEIAADIYVLELSSFQLETTQSLNLAAGAVLNISEDHRDRYATLAEYTAAKHRIYQQSAICVYNADDSLTRPVARKTRCAFSQQKITEAEFYLQDDQLIRASLMRNSEKLMAIDELRVPGRHNAVNALAAAAIVSAVEKHHGINKEEVKRGLQNFEGLRHRVQWVAQSDGVDWYNDSKGTNVGATIAALEGMARPVVLIAGGDGKGADFSALAEAIEKHGCTAILIGRDGPLIQQQLPSSVRSHREADMLAAVSCAKKIAQPGESVLLSPACASFDMYSSYEARGDDFINTVQQVLS